MFINSDLWRGTQSINMNLWDGKASLELSLSSLFHYFSLLSLVASLNNYASMIPMAIHISKDLMFSLWKLSQAGLSPFLSS
jgi:hypothetical protein